MAKVILQSVYDKLLAEQLKVILDKKGIKNKIIRSQSNIEAVYLAQNSNPFEIYIEEIDLLKAEEIINPILKHEELEIDLTSFTNDELIDVVINPDEWHESFIIKAKELISERNITIPQEKITENSSKKIVAKLEGVNAGFSKLAFFWIITIATGIYGLVAAYVFWRVKTRDLDGTKYYYYNCFTRTHGKWMFIAGLIVCIIYAILLFDVWNFKSFLTLFT